MHSYRVNLRSNQERQLQLSFPQTQETKGSTLNKEDIEQLDTGHIALLKGDAWNGNKGLGIVHRSPHAEDHYKRLYMTVDFVDLYLSIYQNFLNNQ